MCVTISITPFFKVSKISSSLRIILILTGEYSQNPEYPEYPEYSKCLSFLWRLPLVESHTFVILRRTLEALELA